MEHLSDHRLHADRGESTGDEHTCHQCKCNRHAHVAKDQKKGRHQQKDHAVRHFTIAAKSSASTGPSKPWRQPLINCSMQNITISAPALGTLAVYVASGISEGARKLPRSFMKFWMPN